MEFRDAIDLLVKYGNEQTKRIHMNHGAKEPLFGVKYGDIKKIYSRIKKDHELSLKLYDTGNSDAMVLACLIADEKQITKEILNRWIQKAYWYMLSEYSVASVAAESLYGWESGMEWIESDRENIASGGWATLAWTISVLDNDKLDLNLINDLMSVIQGEIHSARNRVRFTMNNFIIAVGSYIPDLAQEAMDIAVYNGKVKVDMGKTSCKVPYAPEYILKVADRNRLGVKRKFARI